MNDELVIKKRFQKPYHFLNKMENNPSRCLAEVFINFHLDDFRDEIILWQQLALTNDRSAYEEGDEREDLIDFTHELIKLIEALHILNQKRNQRKKYGQFRGLSKKAKKILSKMNNPVLLTNEEKANPNLVIKRFCKIFQHSYAKIEILDLLDAVITYDGGKEVYKGNLILFYQHVNYLIRIAFMMDKNKKFLKN